VNEIARRATTAYVRTCDAERTLRHTLRELVRTAVALADEGPELTYLPIGQLMGELAKVEQQLAAARLALLEAELLRQ